MSNCFVGEEKINKLVKAFHMKGFEIYAVGGCVRDLLMHKHPKDIDFCTNASIVNMYGVMKTLVQDMGEKCYIIPTGEQYGTLTFHFDSETQFEVTCYRKDGTYHDGRHPDEVVFTTNIEEDLARRDFTCNAIAMNWETKELIDPFGGETDIQNGIIRCVGNPRERFEEDALRIIRLARFAIKYEFDIEENTYNAAIDLVDNIDKVSKERIGAELTKIFSYHLECLQDGYTKTLLMKIISKIFDRVNMWEKFGHFFIHFFDCHNPLSRWRMCCNSQGDEEKVSKEINKFAIGKEICYGVRNLNRAINFFICNRGTPNVKRVLSIVRTDEERKAFFEYLSDYLYSTKIILNTLAKNEPYDVSHLAIDGRWVEDTYGVSGEYVGKMLEDALSFVVTYPNKNTKKEIKNYLDKKYGKEVL